MSAQFGSDLSGIGSYMQKGAPVVDDPTLMVLGGLLELIGELYEPSSDDYGDLVRSGYRVATAWLMNQERAS